LVVGLGTITGTVTQLAPAKAFPATDVPDRYAALATTISGTANFDKQVLSAGYNPWGLNNIDGVYVIRPTADFTLKNCRIHGTLVVVMPAGSKLIIDNNVFLHPYRPDYPTLIVVGEADFKYQSGTATLQESAMGFNYNPTGAPYNGQTDGSMDDSYPSEIQGLVHVTGKITWRSTARVRGLVLCERTGFEVVKIEDSPVVTYEPSLFTNAPQWYTTDVKMVPQAGTWRQLAN
jgi:hypothetical protein